MGVILTTYIRPGMIFQETLPETNSKKHLKIDGWKLT